MTKLLHTADIHLDSPLKSMALRNADLARKVQSATRTTLEKIIDLSLNERVEALLISGDLFDGAQRSAKTAAFLTEQFDRLRQSEIRVFLIKGNHDAENPISGDITLPNNVHVFGGRGGKVQIPETDIWIHGVSYSGRNCPDSLLGKFPPPESGAVNIAMLHTSLAGSTGHDNYAPCRVEELANMGFDYWALGHIHKRQVLGKDPWIVIPGIPQGRDTGEMGVKSITLIEVDGKKIDATEIPTSTVEFNRIEVSLDGLESEDEIRAKIRSSLESHVENLVSEDAILRISLTGKTEMRWNLLRDQDTWRELVANMAESTDRLWVDGLEVDLAELNPSRDNANSVDELGQMMEMIIEEEGFKRTALEDLDELLTQLPPSARAELLPDEESRQILVKNLATDGMQYIYANLRGVSE